MTLRSAFAATALALVFAAPIAQATPPDNTYDVSDAAMSLAVRGADGQPVGVSTYATPHDALKAGDTAAFLVALRDENVQTSRNAWPSLLLAIDAAAADDFAMAGDLLDKIDATAYGAPLATYVGAWISALEGDEDAAVSDLRDGGRILPGMVADLSLASMLEAFGRDDEALAVYASMIPNDIVAPDHSFDVKGLAWTDVKTVIQRRTLLLRKLGRVEEAKATYQLLADAEPEKAASYQSIIASLDDAEQYDDAPLTLRRAFARSLLDLNNALYIQKLIRTAMVGGDRDFGYDETSASLDQIALVLDPTDEDVRENVINGLYAEALYEGAAHVALSAPEQTSAIKTAAAQTLIMGGDDDGARAALSDALEIVEDKDRLATLGNVIGMYALLGDETTTLELADEALSLSDNDGKRASSHAIKAGALEHFGKYPQALAEAEKALALDNTHSRRTTVANLLGEVGRADEGLDILRRELIARPNDPYMLNTLGYYLITKTDKYEEGYRALARAASLTEHNAYIDDSLGWAKYQMGDFNGARVLIENSRQELLPHRHWEIEDHMGDIYWRLGDKKKAREAWETSLKEHPPRKVENDLKDKLANGLTKPAPEKRKLPDVELETAGQGERDI